MLRALSSPGPPSRDVADQLRRIASLVHHDATLADAFDAGFRHLARHYRCEYVFKTQVVSKVVFGRHSPNTASAHLELAMGRAVADVVIVNGTTSVYELKTDLDSFARLATQLEQYGTRAEFVNVVVSEQRVAPAIAAAPTWVGIHVLRRNGALVQVRPPTSCIENLDPRHLFSILRVDEARRAVEGATGHRVEGPTAQAWSRLREHFSTLTPRLANKVVGEQLRLRASPGGRLACAPEVPPSLRALAYAQPLSGRGQRRVLDTLASPAGGYRELATVG